MVISRHSARSGGPETARVALLVGDRQRVDVRPKRHPGPFQGRRTGRYVADDAGTRRERARAQTAVLEASDDRRGGPELLTPQLGVAVQVAAKGDQLVAEQLDGLFELGEQGWVGWHHAIVTSAPRQSERATGHGRMTSTRAAPRR